jgi:thiamine biosynthesis protein ThiS
VQVIVNGQPRELPEGASVRTLIEELGLGKAICAAEVNKTVVPKRQHESHALKPGDAIEVVTLVGGG